ncbi:uncharacterized protein LOC135105805 isoform X2 [Scylla paramamosain]|uniref:uncharacterized protein LOC135105805 isoform X2 n=1 Tax=Scylla paramamosain TaxID=85552 RepID=UPI003083A5C2
MRLQLKEGGSRPWPEECCGSETDQLPEDNASASTTTSTIAAAAAAAAATLHSPQQHHHQYLAEHHHSLYPGLPATLSGEPRPSQLLEDDLKEVLARGSKSGVGVLLPLVGVVVGAWALGAWGASWAWLVISVAFTWALVTGALQRAAQDAARHESLRLSRRRALQADESCEWLNLLVNRWWVFSSASIFARVKAALDPRLAEAKPAFLETISLKQLSLGERTPVLRSVRAWDVTTTTDPSSPRRPHCPTRPPPGLAHAPTHTIALVCDLALDSDSFSRGALCKNRRERDGRGAGRGRGEAGGTRACGGDSDLGHGGALPSRVPPLPLLYREAPSVVQREDSEGCSNDGAASAQDMAALPCDGCPLHRMG